MVTQLFRSPDALFEQRVKHRGFGKPMLAVVAVLVGVVLIGFAGYCWMPAVEHAADLGTRDAAIVVGPPVAVYVGWVLVTML